MKRQRGVALITVLLVVAIVTVISAAMISRQQLSIRSTSNQLLARQAWHYALGGEALAQSILQRDAQSAPPATAAPVSTPTPTPTTPATPPPSVDHLRERWAQPQPAFKVEQAEIRLRIDDLAGRFNLNNLVQDMQPNAAAVAQFRRLLLRLQISEPYAERLVDWLDADQQPTGETGAEENAYLLLDPPYRSADQRLFDLSELRLLLGMREEDFQRLAPHVSTLPPGTPLNVNTASALVLSTLADEFGLGVGEALVQARPSTGFANIEAFRAQPALGAVQLQDAALAVGSQYFQATSEVRLAERRIALVSLLKREDDGAVRVLQRNLGQPPRLAPTSDGER